MFTAGRLGEAESGTQGFDGGQDRDPGSVATVTGCGAGAGRATDEQHQGIGADLGFGHRHLVAGPLFGVVGPDRLGVSLQQGAELFSAGKGESAGQQHRAQTVRGEGEPPVLVGEPLLGRQAGGLVAVGALGVDGFPQHPGQGPQGRGVVGLGEGDHQVLCLVEFAGRDALGEAGQIDQDAAHRCGGEVAGLEGGDDAREAGQVAGLGDEMADLTTGVPMFAGEIGRGGAQVLLLGRRQLLGEGDRPSASGVRPGAQPLGRGEQFQHPCGGEQGAAIELGVELVDAQLLDRRRPIAVHESSQSDGTDSPSRSR